MIWSPRKVWRSYFCSRTSSLLLSAQEEHQASWGCLIVLGKVGKVSKLWHCFMGCSIFHSTWQDCSRWWSIARAWVCFCLLPTCCTQAWCSPSIWIRLVLKRVVEGGEKSLLPCLAMLELSTLSLSKGFCLVLFTNCGGGYYVHLLEKKLWKILILIQLSLMSRPFTLEAVLLRDSW